MGDEMGDEMIGGPIDKISAMGPITAVNWTPIPKAEGSVFPHAAGVSCPFLRQIALISST